MTRRKMLRNVLDFNEFDLLLDLESEEQQVRVATSRAAANRNLEDSESDSGDNSEDSSEDDADYYHFDYWSRQSGWNDDNATDYKAALYYDDYEGDTGQHSSIFKTAAQFCGVLVGTVILIMIVGYSTRYLSERRKKEGRGTSSSAWNKRRRHRSTSRGRPRLRAGSQSSRRTKELDVKSVTDENYQLVEDNSSLARNNRHRSRSASRKRSKSRTRSQSSRRAKESDAGNINDETCKSYEPLEDNRSQTSKSSRSSKRRARSKSHSLPRSSQTKMLV